MKKKLKDKSILLARQLMISHFGKDALKRMTIIENEDFDRIFHNIFLDILGNII